LVGTWRSLVAHTLGVRGVGGSNPLVPTIHYEADRIVVFETQPIKEVMSFEDRVDPAHE
jgi:hypothetical protein